MSERLVLTCMKQNWKSLVIIIVPILLLPMVVTGNKQMQCGYIIAIVSIFWVTEVMHIAVTSLIPIVLFPAFGILKPTQVAGCYMKDITLMLIGGLIVAKTIENQNLHRRMALHILKLMGPNPVFQYLGFMLATWFLSMWISNSASAAMMITLADAVVDQWVYVAKCDDQSRKENSIEDVPGPLGLKKSKTNSFDSEESEIITEELQQLQNVGKGLLISIAYSASVGGIATLSGTPPNLVFYGLLEEKYKNALGMNYGNFMLFCFPLSFTILIIIWITILLRYVGFVTIFKKKRDPFKDKITMKLITDEIESLGPISYGEVSTFVVFIGLVLLWILREPGFPLWGWFFIRYDAKGNKINYWTDGLSAILATLCVFNFPSMNPFKNYKKKISRLIDWKYIEKGFPWGFVFLFGGGFALATGCEKSGLSDVLGKSLTKLQYLPHYVIILVVCLGISLFTEFTSNSVTATVLLPTMLKMAECINMHPIEMGLAVVISCSFAFCLPAATPPNAIVFSTGKIHVIDMVSVGIFLNIICVFLLSFLVYYYAIPIFHTNVFPSSIKKNCTWTK
uniref:Slc13a-5 n=1 Tax=Schmidtea mediterranea TaxID=79327 RepID=A0A0H3YJ28_SCHMD|nr:slc13a-5 [Schmidtea mediterranea]